MVVAPRKPLIVTSSTEPSSIFSIQPAFEIIGQLLVGGNAHDIEPQREFAAVLHAEHRLRRVLEHEAFGRGEGEAELRMQEAPAAHEAFARVLAIDQPVDLAQIFRALAAGGAAAANIGAH